MELEIIAFIASALGVGGCLPQIIKIMRTKNTSALSYGTYFLVFISGILWTIYGFIAPVYAIIFWNSISTVMAATILGLKFWNEKTKNLHKQAYSVNSKKPTHKAGFLNSII